ncbi:ABC transporter permease [Sphingomonas bacterium]|uniref:ABC transporter permease n=1 Tax=Sphingomonas bacterium TaxID=1895847 RepID=UPI00157763DB|nr:ABC transporter permease [Sphingomonas bacterium]
MKRRIKPSTLLLLPALVFVVIVFIAPVVILLSEGFRQGHTWSVNGYASFFADRLNQRVLVRTLRIGVLVTATAAVFGYATALSIASLPPKMKGRMIVMVTVPLMISPVARTYAWLVILARQGLVNGALMQAGLLRAPIRFLFTEQAIFIGLLQLLLPVMVLTLVSAVENLPKDAVAAARVLGATWLEVFWKIVLPLTCEGLVVGGTLVFTGALTAYITPAILGGSKVLMLETLLYQDVSVANDIASASIVAFIIVFLGVAANFGLRSLATGKSERSR